LAEHLLHDYHKELPDGVTLIPSSGGVFEVTRGDHLLFSKKETGRFPEEGELDEAMGRER
jgi:selenoprotein W-related protein